MSDDPYEKGEPAMTLLLSNWGYYQHHQALREANELWNAATPARNLEHGDRGGCPDGAA